MNLTNRTFVIAEIGNNHEGNFNLAKKIAKKYSEICKSLDIKYISQKNNLMSGNYYKFTVISPSENISTLLPKVKTTTSKVYDYAIGNSGQIPLKHLCLPIWYGLEESISDKVVSELKESKKV